MQEPKLRHPSGSPAVVNWPELYAMINNTDISIPISLRSTAQSDGPSDIAMADWDFLFSAVTARLITVVNESLGEASSPAPTDRVCRGHADALECVAALEQLHRAALCEIRRHEQLEARLIDTQAALAQARSELLDSQAAKRQASHLAMHDRLTALPNRSLFRERLNHLLTCAQPPNQALTVLYLDLDGFKPINDAYGHDAGGELLQIIASRLIRSVGAQHMVSRLGGDEFACLLADSQNREQLCELADKLFDAVSAPLKIGKLNHTVRPAIGIASCPADGTTCDALLKNAHAAMHRAKRRQIGYVFFDQADE